MIKIPVNKNTIFVFGVFSYLLFLASYLYAIGFMTNEIVPKSIDSGTPSGFTSAIIINLILMGLFAIQHSVMARPQFKNWWHNYVPVAAERSVYVLASSVLLFLLFWLWQPMPEMVWQIENDILRTILWTFHGAGWLLVLISTF